MITFPKKDQEKNARLITDLTARGLGMSRKTFLEIPEIRFTPGPLEKMKKALEYVSDKVVFPAELPAFEPDVAQTPMTDKMAVGLYGEFDGNNQILYAGGSGGTIWFKVSPDFPVGVLEPPFVAVGTTGKGDFVLKQQYIAFLRQFLPDPEA